MRALVLGFGLLGLRFRVSEVHMNSLQRREVVCKGGVEGVKEGSKGSEAGWPRRIPTLGSNVCEYHLVGLFGSLVCCPIRTILGT